MVPGGVPLGRIHNLAQEEAAPREVVEDHDNEGPVEADCERRGRRVPVDLGAGGCLHAPLIQLQRGLMDHLVGTDRAWRMSTCCVGGAFRASSLRLLPPSVFWMAKLRLREGHLLAPHLRGSPRTSAGVCPPPEPRPHLDFLPREWAAGADP